MFAQVPPPPGFELKSFIEAALINTAVLLPIIMALVTLYGKFGASGKLQLALSLITGFVLGVAVQMATVGYPSTYVDYLALIIYGLIPGLVASGVYETGKGLVARSVPTG